MKKNIAILFLCICLSGLASAALSETLIFEDTFNSFNDTRWGNYTTSTGSVSVSGGDLVLVTANAGHRAFIYLRENLTNVNYSIEWNQTYTSNGNSQWHTGFWDFGFESDPLGSGHRGSYVSSNEAGGNAALYNCPSYTGVACNLTANSSVIGIANFTGSQTWKIVHLENSTGWTGIYRNGTLFREIHGRLTGTQMGKIIFGTNSISQKNVGYVRLYSLSESFNPNVSVTLLIPPDNTVTGSNNLTFNASYVALSSNLTNATYYIWNSDGTVFNRTISEINGTTNLTSVNFTGFTAGMYDWNVFACVRNSTASVCRFADNNFSFSWVPFEIISTSFNASTYETSTETFTMSIQTLEDIVSVSSRLIYNGSSYLGTTSCVANQCTLSRSIDVPLVSPSVNSENKTFFWNISVFPESGSSITFSTESMLQGQNVSKIFLQACGSGVGNLTLNFTAYDEQNRTRIAPFLFDATFNFWLGGGTVYKNYSFNNNTIVERTLCISPGDKTFRTDAHITYSGTNASNGTYSQRNYFFQNASLTNTLQSISLFLLNIDSSTSFIQKVVTTSQIPVRQALIFTQRYYPEDNTFETVSVTKTDNAGQSVGFYETEIPDYKHFITKNGELLKVTEQGKIFPEVAPFTLTFIIGESLTSIWEPFEGIGNLFSNLTYNKTTQIVTYTWIDISGALSIANLTVERVYASQANQLICSESSILQAGILTCNVTGQTGTLIAKGFIGRSPAVLDQLITIVVNELREALARPFLFLWILFLIGAVGLGLYSPPVGIPIFCFVLIIGALMGLAAIGWIFIWGIIALAIWILWETR